MIGEFCTPEPTENERLYNIAGRFGQLLALRDIGEGYYHDRSRYPALKGIDPAPITQEGCSIKQAAMRICCRAYADPGLLRRELTGALNFQPKKDNTDIPGARIRNLGLATYGGGINYTLAPGVVPALHLLERYQDKNRQVTLAPKLWKAAEAAIEMTPFFVNQTMEKLVDADFLPNVVESLGQDYIYYVGDIPPKPVETLENGLTG